MKEKQLRDDISKIKKKVIDKRVTRSQTAPERGRESNERTQMKKEDDLSLAYEDFMDSRELSEMGARLMAAEQGEDGVEEQKRDQPKKKRNAALLDAIRAHHKSGRSPQTGRVVHDIIKRGKETEFIGD